MGQIIVGIDPGTTLGYAVLDLNGCVLDVGSGKGFTLGSLISRVVLRGRPLAVGCDKNPPPSFVARFSVKTGCRLIVPDADLLVSDKRALINPGSAKNRHEADALASAAYAAKRIKPILKKIDRHVRDRSHIGRVRELVVLRGLGIAQAEEVLREMPVPERTVRTKDYREEFKCLQARLERLENDIVGLKLENISLRGRVNTEKKINIVRKPDKAWQQLLAFKEQRIRSLCKKMVLQSRENGRLIARQKALHSILSSLDSSVLLKRLTNLGWKEYLKRRKTLAVRAGDVLLVDDPTVYSQKTIEQLQGIVKVIVVKRKPTSKLVESFLCMEAKPVCETEFFAVVDRKSYELKLAELNIIGRIVEEYRKTRVTS
ncbi:MAG: DUF460 domain-containing protein [archaeon]